MGPWHWWVFLVALVTCAAIAQFRAGMAAESRGQTDYALKRPRQMIFWSLVFGAIYAAIVTAAVGYLWG